MTKIFLDDCRSPEPNMKGFDIVRSYQICVQLLRVFQDDVEFIDLDYDLGTKETGMDVLRFMAKENIVPKRINIHSDHPIGAQEMQKYAEKHFTKTKVTTIRLNVL